MAEPKTPRKPTAKTPATRTSKAAPKRTRTPKTPTKLTSFDPRTGRRLGEVAASTPAEVRDAVARARKIAPEWAAVPIQGRVRMMKEVRHRLHDRMEELIETVAAECGKPRAEALAHDVMPVALMLLYFERVSAKVLRPEAAGRFIGPLAGAFSRIEWRPFGVVGAITPWNYPLLNSFLAFAPALFAGNTVVIKPSEVTPRCGELIRDLLEPLPPSVATVVQGAGEVGAALVDAPCDKISFIGSPATGRKICEAAGRHLTPVVMELGGKDAAIVCEDADLDAASSGVLWGAFANAGQTCCSVERVYVVDSVADEFEDKLVAKLKTVQESDGDIGPLTAKRQLEVVERHVADAVEKGAVVLAGGPDAAPENAEGSLWYAPTVLEGITDEMDILREETFGPVLPIIRVRDEEEAVTRANEDAVNLTASVWTTDAKKSRALASRLRSGTISVNSHMETAGLPWTPWGGIGESGFGRLNGKLGLREFVVPVHVARNSTPRMRRIWWYPYDEHTTETMRSITTLLAAPRISDKARALTVLAREGTKALKTKL